jgi:hypothetical protein
MTLQTILTGIDWTANIQASLGSGSTLASIDGAAHRIAVWSMQLEQADVGNPALCFVREMQHSIQHSGALIGLCLYKPSAASSRTIVESCLYYTYFRTHPEELATLVFDPKYYVGKSEIIEYHRQHTSKFKAMQDALGLVGRLETWYSQTSAVVHGQLPGAWSTHSELTQTSYSKEVQDLALGTLLGGVEIVNDLLLCTVAKPLWNAFAPDAKTYLTKGMPAPKRQALSLDIK